MTNRIVHFEIHASDPEAAMAFYGSVFGWTFEKFGDWDYWGIVTGTGEPGIDGGLNKRIGPSPVPGAPVMGATLTVDVEDVEAAGAAILKAGGALAHDRAAVPGYGWTAYYRDPDGNVLGLFQRDGEAR